jgi:hypothetical protein
VKPARILTAALIAVVATAVTWVALDIWTGSGAVGPPLPWAVAVCVAALVIVVLSAGLPVRRWQRGTLGRQLDPLVAARTAVLAKAAAYGGAVLTGWFLGQALVLLPNLIGSRRGHLVVGLATAGLAVLLSAVGFVVQAWCRLPPGDDDDTEGPRDPDLHSVT